MAKSDTKGSPQKGKAAPPKGAREQLEQLVNQQPAACTFAIYGALLLAGYLQVWDPGMASIEAAKRTLKDRNELNTLVSDASSLDGMLTRQRAQMPEFISEYAWMETFLNAARSNKVRLDNLAPRLEAQAWLKSSVEVDITATVTGSYADVVRFVAWLETDKPFYRVTELALHPAEGGEVTANLVVVVFQREAVKQTS